MQGLFYLGLTLLCLTVICVNFLYHRTSYYKITHKSLVKVLRDKGSMGEFWTYIELFPYVITKAKFLFNVYLETEEGTTTEVDVIMIHKKGIFVFESKNYSGWIFGDEARAKWTQSLPQGMGKPSKKIYFLNPVMQNEKHIKVLKGLIGTEYPYYSVITFSERCTLKNINVDKPHTWVIKRNRIDEVVRNAGNAEEDILSPEQINAIYNKLYPMTQVSDAVKKKHIDVINEKYGVDT